MEKLDISDGELLEEFYLSLHEQQDTLEAAEQSARRGKDSARLMQISAQRNSIQAILNGESSKDPLEEALLAGGATAQAAWQEFVAQVAEVEKRSAKQSRR